MSCVISFAHDDGISGVAVRYYHDTARLEFMFVKNELVYQVVKVMNLQDFLDALSIDGDALKKAKDQQKREVKANDSV